EATTYADFSVDVAAPTIEILQPPPGHTINTGTPTVLVAYSDPQRVDTTTLKVSIAGVDRTSWCVRGPDSASCTIPQADRLPEGTTAIAAEIKDLTNNLGTTTSPVKVDTIAPTAALVSPVSTSNIKQAHPEIHVSYSDGGGSASG